MKATRLANRKRRADMQIRVFELKIDESKLSAATRGRLEFAFIQAKWFSNFVLGQNDLFDWKISKESKVPVFVFNEDTKKCDIEEVREVNLGSQIRRGLLDRTVQDVISLGKAKKAGCRVGRLKFKREVNAIPLAQYGTTYKINRRTVSIQKLGQFPVRGLEQIRGMEYANAVLLRKPSGFYIKVTCYVTKEKPNRSGAIGLDFGIKDSVTDSNGISHNWNFPIPKELRRKQAKLARMKKGSSNYRKQRRRVQRSYERLTNRKEDAANKFVHSLKSYERVVIQDENIKGWHAGLFGKQVQQSILGRIKSKLTRLETSVVINRWLPTTQFSPVSFRNVPTPLNQREFRDGTFSENRDVKSAKTILCFGLYNPKLTSKELRGLPVEEKTSMFSNYKFENVSYAPTKQEAPPVAAG